LHYIIYGRHLSGVNSSQVPGGKLYHGMLAAPTSGIDSPHLAENWFQV